MTRHNAYKELRRSRTAFGLMMLDAGHADGLVAGVRQDFRPGPQQTWAAVGVQGLAPYWFEVQATIHVGASGRTHARFEVEYELLLTNRLILQPLVENAIEHGVGTDIVLSAAAKRSYVKPSTLRPEVLLLVELVDIYPTVVAISSEGSAEISEDEIKTLFEQLIGERRGHMVQPATHTVDVRRAPQEGDA